MDVHSDPQRKEFEAIDVEFLCHANTFLGVFTSRFFVFTRNGGKR